MNTSKGLQKRNSTFENMKKFKPGARTEKRNFQKFKILTWQLLPQTSKSLLTQPEMEAYSTDRIVLPFMFQFQTYSSK